MRRALSILETIINDYPIEMNRIIKEYDTKIFANVVNGEIVIDKDFMKIFSTIAYAHYDNPSKYLINKDDCVGIIEPSLKNIPLGITNHMIDIEKGDSNMLRKTCTFILTLKIFCEYEHEEPVAVLKEIYDEPANRDRNIKTRLKAFFKIQKNDYDLKTTNFKASVFSILSNKRIPDVISEIYNMY